MIVYLWTKLLDLVFPRRCPICDEVVGGTGQLICEGCKGAVMYVTGAVCLKCGKKLATEEEEYCYDCAKRPHYYKSGTAPFEYKSVSSAIYRFKYKGRQEYADFFGEELAKHLKGYLKEWKPDALIPVPIHASRRNKRGYNQAEVLARRLSEHTGIPMRTDIIKREKKTAPQKNLNVKERQNNLKKAFKIHRNDVELNTIVIIDDIYTTGSTIDAVALKLRKAGVANIYYAALSIGKGL